MVGSRNIAVHEYQELQIPIVMSIIETHLDEFLDYARVVLKKDQQLAEKGKKIFDAILFDFMRFDLIQ